METGSGQYCLPQTRALVCPLMEITPGPSQADGSSLIYLQAGSAYLHKAAADCSDRLSFYQVKHSSFAPFYSDGRKKYLPHAGGRPPRIYRAFDGIGSV